MAQTSSADLAQKHCEPCEGNVRPIAADEARSQLKELPGWQLSSDAKRIHRSWKVQDFMAGLDFFQRVGELAESEGHHPDLHLEGYRNVRIELSTHAINGLSENDFILAARIDQLPIAEK